jgi:hypothetical protein
MDRFSGMLGGKESPYDRRPKGSSRGSKGQYFSRRWIRKREAKPLRCRARNSEPELFDRVNDVPPACLEISITSANTFLRHTDSEKAMVRDGETLRRFEEDLVRRWPHRSFQESLQIYEAMWKEAVALGVLPLADPLEGIEADIELARVLNCLKKSLPE